MTTSRDPAEARAVTQPTLLLVGGDSPKSVRDENQWLAETLRDVTVVVLPGQQHIADQLDPDTFARHLLDFLVASLPRSRIQDRTSVDAGRCLAAALWTSDSSSALSRMEYTFRRFGRRPAVPAG